VKGNRIGYIDTTGKVVVPPVIRFFGGNNGGEFHDGLLEIGVSDGVYVDARGRTAIKKKFYRGWDFSEGLAVAMEVDGGKWGYIDTKGNFAISPRFKSSPTDYVWSFEGGLAKIEVAGKFGYIDRTGDFKIQPHLLDGDSFHEGMARVIVEGPCVYSRIAKESPCGEFGVVPKGVATTDSLPVCKYAFIDESGNIISEQRYDYALHFAEGLAPVEIGKSWGYINNKGEVVVAPHFESAAPFADGLALVSEGGLFGYIDRSGAYVIKPRFSHAEDFSEGLAVVGGSQSEYWFIGHDGQQAFAPRFALASPYFKGLAHVKILSKGEDNESSYRGVFSYIDTKGRVVFTYKR